MLKQVEMHHNGRLLSVAQKWCTVVVHGCKPVLDWVIIEKMIDYIRYIWNAPQGHFFRV